MQQRPLGAESSSPDLLIASNHTSLVRSKALYSTPPVQNQLRLLPDGCGIVQRSLFFL